MTWILASTRRGCNRNTVAEARGSTFLGVQPYDELVLVLAGAIVEADTREMKQSIAAMASRWGRTQACASSGRAHT